MVLSQKPTGAPASDLSNLPLGDLVTKARQALAAGDANLADQICEILLQKVPNQENAMLLKSAIMIKRGQFDDAKKILQKAIGLYPETFGFYHNLGKIQIHEKNIDAAIKTMERAVLLKPDNLDAKQTLAGLYISAPSQKPGPFGTKETAAALTVLLKDPTISCEMTLFFWKDTAFTDPELAPMFNYVEECANYNLFKDNLDTDIYNNFINHEFIIHGMMRLLINDMRVERTLTYLRRWLLEQRANDEKALDDASDFICALSRYCFFNEHIFFPTKTEEEFIKDNLATPKTHTDIALLGCYQNLYQHKKAKDFASHKARKDSQLFDRLMQITVDDPMAEKKLKSKVKQFKPLKDNVSGAVAEQYEENPYPRWAHIDEKPIPEAIQNKAKGKHILNAGCGTGREAAHMSLDYPKAKVTAIDLSKASIAYGMRKTKDMGLTNIDFMQADILDLPDMDQKFDFITSSGVIHHMKDPIAAWQILLDRLKPGGLLRLGLYSTIARQSVKKSHEIIAERGFDATPEGIRAFRLHVLQMDDDDKLKKDLTNVLDFYSMSQFRDLVFHVQETTFTLLELRDLLRDFDLHMIKIQMGKMEHFQAFMATNPDKDQYKNLEKLHGVEQENPNMFIGMYNFFCYKKADEKHVDWDWINSRKKVI